MENLHLKNLKTDYELTLPTNQNYLNSVFKTKNLTYEQFTNCYLIHPYHNKEEKRRFLTGLYNLYKKEIQGQEMYKLLTDLELKKYNTKITLHYYDWYNFYPDMKIDIDSMLTQMVKKI